MVLVLGEATMAQEVPSHRSIRVRPPPLPTAQQSDANAQVTLKSQLLCPALVLGEGTMVHEIPSHRSISVR